jgi:hypothetical protein
LACRIRLLQARPKESHVVASSRAAPVRQALRQTRAMATMGDNLYQTDRIELAFGDDPIAAWREHCSVEAYIENVVLVAKVVLAKAGHDPHRPATLLCAETIHDEPRHLAAQVLKYAERLLREIEAGGDVMAVCRHAMQLVERGQQARHSEEWAPAVFQKRRRDAANRKNLARHNAKLRAGANEYWAPWQEAYRVLRAAAMSKAAARREIGGRIAAEMGQGEEPPDETTLRKWLSG